MKISRLLALAVAVGLIGTLWPAPVTAQNIKQGRQGGRSAEERRDIEALVQLADGVASGKDPAPTDIKVAWDSQHFVKGSDNTTYIPYTIVIDRSALSTPDAVVFIRALAKGATTDKDKAKPAWDDVHFVQVSDDGKLSRAMALRPGEYDVLIGVKEKTPRQQRTLLKKGMLRHPLTVPDFSGPGLSTSSIFLGAIEQTDAVKPEDQQEHPYTFGTMRIVPSNDGKLKKSGDLQLLFWIYGTQAAEGKPDVTVEYSFHQKTAEGEKYFNKTAPQDLSVKTLPPQFDLAAGHQLPGSLVVPLGSFPAGDYRLEVKITDKLSGQSLTQNAEFTVES